MYCNKKTTHLQLKCNSEHIPFQLSAFGHIFLNTYIKLFIINEIAIFPSLKLESYYIFITNVLGITFIIF